MKILISGGTVVTDRQQRKASVIIENDRIKEIIEHNSSPRDAFDTIVDATGCYVLPGVIDTHVHFREPGMTHKADIESESRAAAYGGVTSYFEMPNTNPQTTTAEALAEKQCLAREKSSVNYAFFPGATNNNAEFLSSLDVHSVPGIKLFMGSSTGNMLVDKREALDTVFSLAAQKGLPVVAHCEDSDIINRNMEAMKERFETDDPPLRCHPEIRSDEACRHSVALGIEMADRQRAHFHVTHISTASVLQQIEEYNGSARLTAEVCVPHLLFTADDYDAIGARMKCNPAVQSTTDRAALRQALRDGRIQTIATDHAPHLLSEKQGGAAKAVSGMPMVQFSLPAMLTLVTEGVMTIERLVELMSHNPARLFGIDERGFLREGFKADIAIVRENPWTITPACVQSKCGWSPLEGRRLQWQVCQTICNGHLIYNNGEFDEEYRGEAISFRNL